jgi:hypothetical protein
MSRLILVASALSILGALKFFTANAVQPEARFVELLFMPSAAACEAAKQQLSKQTSPQARHVTRSECFVAVHSPMDRPDTQPAAAYILQVLGDRPLIWSANGKTRLQYRAVGTLHLAKDEEGANPIPAGAGPIQTYRMLVFSQPTQGSESVYNDWYEHQHVADVLRVSGFVSGQRFERIGGTSDAMTFPPFLVEFELRSADLTTTGSEIGARIRDGRTRMSPSFDAKSAVGLVLRSIDQTGDTQ